MICDGLCYIINLHTHCLGEVLFRRRKYNYMICHLQCCGSSKFPCHYLTTVKKITPQKIFDRMLGTVSLKLFLSIRSTSDKRLFFLTHISRTHFVSSSTHSKWRRPVRREAIEVQILLSQALMHRERLVQMIVYAL